MTDDAIGPEALDESAAEAVLPPTAVGPGPAAPAPTPRDGGDVELLGLIDRLASLLDRSDLTELEVESGGTALVLRKPAALVPVAAARDGAPAAAVPVVRPGPPGGRRRLRPRPWTPGRR